MSADLDKAVAKSRAAMQGPFAKERQQFKALLLSNPNYFGSLEASPFQPVLPLAGNTYYEELVCVGYQPQQERLEGVVHVYQPTGYGSGLCGAGSTEYVRFYLSFDNGATWQDQGYTSFRAWNVPKGTQGSDRLEYAVQLEIDPARKLCFLGAKLVKMRAILSWNQLPPANSPNWNPPWGNRRDATIQIEPRKHLFAPDLFDALKVKVAPAVKTQIAQLLDFDQPLPAKPKALQPVELAAMYKDTVPAHRFAFQQMHALALSPQGFELAQVSKLLPGIEIGPNIGDLLFPTDGNTSYEELTCVGLDPNLPDTLVGIVHVKKSAGYSGGPCTAGSKEYVSFWADFDGNGSFESFLGTASVTVYDLANIPAEGVHYAVRLPVDFSERRKACQEGPVVVPIRAILSWNVAVPGNAPSQVPVWGNREQTLVHVAPKGIVHGTAGKISVLGGIPTGMIDNTDGMTAADPVSGLPAQFAHNNVVVGSGCPFGGWINVKGAPLPLGYSYTVHVVPLSGGVPTPVQNKLTLVKANGDTYEHEVNPITQRFDYKPFDQNTESLIGRWLSFDDQIWVVTLTSYDGMGNVVGTDSHRIQLDNTGPQADIDITTGTGNCGKFPAGSTIGGTFVATDLHMGSWSIGVKPPGINDPGEGITTPSSGTVNTAPTGDAWTLDTTGMKGCGYVVEVVVSDRTVVHSASLGWQNSASAGFCLEEIEDA